MLACFRKWYNVSPFPIIKAWAVQSRLNNSMSFLILSRNLRRILFILNINSISCICELLKEEIWLVRRHLLKYPEDGINIPVTDVGSIEYEMFQTEGAGKGQMLMYWNRQWSEILSFLLQTKNVCTVGLLLVIWWFLYQYN